MNSRLFFLLMLLLFASEVSFAQSCEPYYPLEKGNEWEVWNYDEKSKDAGKIHYTVLDAQGSGNGKEATIKSEVLDKKGESVSTTEFTMICNNGVLSIDMEMFLPQETLKGFDNMEMTIDGNELQIPSTLSAGQTLPDGVITINITNSGMDFAKMEIRIFNRKVEASESITVPAGTFQCYRISYEMETITTTMGFPMKMKMAAKEWINNGAGVVRTESLNDKGKMMGYTVLGMIKQ